MTSDLDWLVEVREVLESVILPPLIRIVQEYDNDINIGLSMWNIDYLRDFTGVIPKLWKGTWPDDERPHIIAACVSMVAGIHPTHDDQEGPHEFAQRFKREFDDGLWRKGNFVSPFCPVIPNSRSWEMFHYYAGKWNNRFLINIRYNAAGIRHPRVRQWLKKKTVLPIRRCKNRAHASRRLLHIRGDTRMRYLPTSRLPKRLYGDKFMCYWSGFTSRARYRVPSSK